MTSESKKKQWRREGGLDYVKLETRGPYRGDKHQMTIEMTQPTDLGACDAFQAVLTARLSCGSDPTTTRQFYADLKKFAQNWTSE